MADEHGRSVGHHERLYACAGFASPLVDEWIQGMAGWTGYGRFGTWDLYVWALLFLLVATLSSQPGVHIFHDWDGGLHGGIVLYRPFANRQR